MNQIRKKIDNQIIVDTHCWSHSHGNATKQLLGSNLIHKFILLLEGVVARNALELKLVNTVFFLFYDINKKCLFKQKIIEEAVRPLSHYLVKLL